MKVLEVASRVNKSDSGRHCYYNFQIDEPANKLVVSFNFSPTFLQDNDKARDIVKRTFKEYLNEIPYDIVDNYLPIKNLLTVSIDSPIKPLGTAHRHLNNQKHYIASDKSSRGFLPCDVVVGQWCVSIAVHSIVSEYVEYFLQVEVSND